MDLLFPGVSLDEFDFQEEWLVLDVDPVGKNVTFGGLGANSKLELMLDFKENPEQYFQFAVGDLVELPEDMVKDLKPEGYVPLFERF